MKRSAAILCALLLTGSLCGCKQAKTPVDDTPSTSLTTVATTTTAADIKEPEKVAYNPTYASSFSDGVAFIRYADVDGVEHAAAINTAGEMLFEVPGDLPVETMSYQNGICVVNHTVYDKTGKVIASPELSGYDALLSGNCGGYLLAKKHIPLVQPTVTETATDKTEKDATTTTTTETTTTTTTTTTGSDGSTDGSDTTTTLPPAPTYSLSVGVLNNEGEWVHALSADHPVAVAFNQAEQPTEHITVLGDDLLGVYMGQAEGMQYYHFSTNTLTPDYVHYTSVNYQDEDAGIYHQAADGTEERVIKNVVSDYFFKKAFIGNPIVVSEAGDVSLGDAKLYDYEGNALMDLVDYTIDINSLIKVTYVNEHLILPSHDEDGNAILVVLDKEGKPAFDPIPLDIRDTLFTPDDTGFVLASHATDGTVTYLHYDYSGKVTEYANVATFGGFVDGLAAVTLVDGRICYINQKEEIVIH